MAVKIQDDCELGSCKWNHDQLNSNDLDPSLRVFVSETTIRKLMKSYTDSRSPKQLSKINNDLADVQRIMVQNIEDVIQRGEQLSGEYSVHREW